MSCQRRELTGRTFNRWTVLYAVGQRIKSRNYLWLCECRCGRQCVVRGDNLLCGYSPMCTSCRGKLWNAKMGPRRKRRKKA